MTKLVTNNQGLGFAKLARDKGVLCAELEVASRDGRVDAFLTGLRPQILWQNGPHKVVKNNDGIISVWMDCDQIDWTQSNQEALDATGRTQYVDSEVVSEMPRGEKLAGIVEVVFRNYGCYLSDEKLAEHGEPMISPYFQAKINEAFPKLANEHPNGTHWQDENGKWCFTAFRRWRGGRCVRVRRDGRDWGGVWWFGGLRK